MNQFGTGTSNNAIVNFDIFTFFVFCLYCGSMLWSKKKGVSK
jgi:hypothetical protein